KFWKNDRVLSEVFKHEANIAPYLNEQAKVLIDLLNVRPVGNGFFERLAVFIVVNDKPCRKVAPSCILAFVPSCAKLCGYHPALHLPPDKLSRFFALPPEHLG